jgi:hypothetical protein
MRRVSPSAINTIALMWPCSRPQMQPYGNLDPDSTPIHARPLKDLSCRISKPMSLRQDAWKPAELIQLWTNKLEKGQRESEWASEWADR